MVRLKEEHMVQKSISEHCFNSTMVRLKVRPREEHPIKQEVFQFHNGSIKSADVAEKQKIEC